MGLLAQLKLLSNRQISASGISMLNNLGGLGSFGLNSSSGNNHAIGSAGHTGSLFGLDESGNGGTIMNGQVNNGSMGHLMHVCATPKDTKTPNISVFIAI